MPNGRSIVLERQSDADTQGVAGLEDGVDHHWRPLFMATALSTLLGVGSELGVTNNDNVAVTAFRRASADNLNQNRPAGRTPQPEHPVDDHDPTGLSTWPSWTSAIPTALPTVQLAWDIASRSQGSKSRGSSVVAMSSRSGDELIYTLLTSTTGLAPPEIVLRRAESSKTASAAFASVYWLMQGGVTMRPYSLLSISVMFALGLALLPASSVAQQKPLKEQLVGAWVPVSVMVERKDGSKFDPWGPNQNGLSIFTSDGHFVIANTRPDRPKFESDNRLEGSPEENEAVVQGTLFYFGTYSVDEAEKTMTVRIQVSSFPNWEATEQKRPFTIIGDELKWNSPTGTLDRAPAQITLKRAK